MISSIDWQRVALNLRRQGLPVSTQARAIGMDERTANRFARGERRRPPDFNQALRWLDLHFDRCPQRHSLPELTRA